MPCLPLPFPRQSLPFSPTRHSQRLVVRCAMYSTYILRRGLWLYLVHTYIGTQYNINTKQRVQCLSVLVMLHLRTVFTHINLAWLSFFVNIDISMSFLFDYFNLQIF